jgi:lipoyl(octanoyl) transferase
MSSFRPLLVRNLGTVEYADGLALQEELRRAVTAGEAPDHLLLLEHPPVVTLGRNAGTGNLVLAPEALEARGIEFHRTGRGGDVTFHGPGQLVGYPVIDLKPDRRDVHRYVRDLEETLIRTLGDFGVLAGRIPGLTGVWIGDLKIAAIGVRISRWVTTHGFAFNVDTDLDFFRVIVPCGIADRGVTSLSRVLGREVTVHEVRPVLARRFAEVFERRIVEETPLEGAA